MFIYNVKKCQDCLILYQNKDDNFYISKSNKDGLRTICKICDKIKSKKWREKNKEHSKLRDKFYYIKNRAKILKRAESPVNRFSCYKTNARKKNIELEISLIEFTKITNNKCYYCNQYNKNKNYCGIDRIDSNVGYINGNLLPCCSVCNQMKSDFNQKDFLNKIQEIHNYLIINSKFFNCSSMNF